jgi:hypothetical protein
MAINNIEWLNNNMHRNYPIMDDCSALSTSNIYLPTSFITDINITVPNNNDLDINKRFFISRVTQYGSIIKVFISYKPETGESFECLMSADIPSDITASFSMTDKLFDLFPVASIPVDYSAMNRIKAYMIVGTCVDIISNNDMLFNYEDATISPMSVNVFIDSASDPDSEYNYIESVTIINKDGVVIQKVTNDLVIEGGDGINLRLDESVYPPVLIIEAQEDEDTDIDQVTSVDDVVNRVMEEIGTPITSINGILPAENGNITITGKSCTEVTSGNASIYISNPCAVPCCPESTYEVLPALNTLQEASSRLIQYFEAMNITINSMQSRLAALIAYRK